MHDAAGLADPLARLKRIAPPDAIERTSGLVVETLIATGHPVVPIHPDVVKTCRPRHRAPPARSPIEEAIAAVIGAICEASPAYGHRRVGAKLRHRGQVVDARRVRRVMREQELRPKHRCRGIAIPNGDHEAPISANVARGLKVHWPDPARLADIAFVAPETGLAHLAGLCPRRLRGCARAFNS